MKTQNPTKIASSQGLRTALALVTALFAGGSAPASAQAPAAGQQAEILASPCLNVRAQPNPDATAVRCLPRGRKLVVLDAQGDWGRVRLPDDAEGWVALRLLGPAAAESAAPGQSDEAADHGTTPATDRESEITRLRLEQQTSLGEERRKRRELEHETVELRQDNAVLRNESARMAAMEAEATSRLSEAEHLLAQAAAEKLELTTRLQVLAAEIDEVRVANARLAASATRYGAAESQARSELEGLEEALARTEAESQARRNELDQDLAAAQADAQIRAGEIARLNDEVAGLRDANAALEADLQERTAAESEAVRRADGLEQTLARTHAESRTRLEDVERELATARHEADRVAADSANLESALSKLRQDKDDLETDVTALAADRSKAESRLEELEQALAAAETEARGPTERLAALESQIQALREANVDLVAAAGARDAARAEVESNLQEVRTALAEAREQAAARAGASDSLELEVQALRKANRGLEERAAARDTALSELQNDLVELETALAGARAEAQGQAVESAELETALEEKAQLQARLQALETEALAERRRVEEDLAARLEAAELFLADTEARRVAASEQLEAALRENERLRQAAQSPTTRTKAGASVAPEVASETASAQRTETAGESSEQRGPADERPKAAAAQPPTYDEDLIAVVEAWARAWSEQRVQDYLSFYSESFVPPRGAGRRAWERQRRQRISTPERIDVRVALVELRRDGNDRAEVEFLQSYDSDGFSDVVVKTLELIREDGLWKIAGERID